jgi:cell division protein FtsZ
MTIHLSMPEHQRELKPHITVIGVGGAGNNAVNNMISSNLSGVEFLVTNTDAQALSLSKAERRIQLGLTITHGLGAGSRPEVGRAAAEEALEEILEHLQGSHMVFITAGMGGGTGTGAGPVIARAARERGILTVGVVTKPFHFEGTHRMRIADEGIEEFSKFVDTLIIIPNQNLFRIANEHTTFADAFNLADDVLHSGVRGVTDLMVMPGLINLDFADIRAVMSEMGKAMMGTGQAEGDKRAVDAAEAAISNPLLDDMSMKGARGILINITGGLDMTLFEVDEAANRIRDEVDPDANIIFGATFNENMEGQMRVSVVATGIDAENFSMMPTGNMISDQIRYGQTASGPNIFATRDTAATDHSAAPAGESAAVEPPAPRVAPQVPAHEAPALREAPAPATMIAETPVYAVSGANALDVKTEPATAVEPEPETITPAPKPTPTEAPAPTAQSEGGDGDPFIAPAPVVPSERPGAASKADAFAEAAITNGGGDAGKRKRGPSLLQRVTMSGRARQQRLFGGDRNDKPATREEPEQPKLGGLESSENKGTRKNEDDLLDIPAFLRRQAN